MTIYRIPVAISWPGVGSPGVNIWHLRTITESLQQPPISEALGALEDFYTAVKPVLRGGVSIESPDVMTTVGDDPEYVAAPVSWTVDVTSGYEGEALAAAVCISWYSVHASRSGRGRTFLSPLTRGSVADDGTLTSTARTTVKDAGTALIHVFDDPITDGSLGIYSPKDEVIRDFVRCNVKSQVAVLTSRR